MMAHHFAHLFDKLCQSTLIVSVTLTLNNGAVDINLTRILTVIIVLI